MEASALIATQMLRAKFGRNLHHLVELMARALHEIRGRGGLNLLIELPLLWSQLDLGAIRPYQSNKKPHRGKKKRNKKIIRAIK